LLPTGKRRQGRPKIKYENEGERVIKQKNLPRYYAIKRNVREPATGGKVENWIDRDFKTGVFHVYHVYDT